MTEPQTPTGHQVGETEPVRPLAETPNWMIFDAIRNEASPLYQSRVPAATQGNVRESFENMMEFPALRNEFYDGLINRIAGEYVHSIAYRNPLSEFKKGAQSYGNTYEEVAVGLLKAHVYDPNQEYLGDDIYGTYKTNVKSVFHSVNRRENYRITLPEIELRKAFTSETGLGALTSQLMEAPITSDNLDEYLQMCNLFPEYARLGGYYRIHVDDVPTSTNPLKAAQDLLVEIRTMINTLPLMPSTRYNAAHMPSIVSKNDIIIFTTPRIHANLDVKALAVLFNEEYAQTANRIIDIPEENFGMTGVQAILTVRDFFFCWDFFYGMRSEYNPLELSTNYFLHHHEAISVSPFVPAILLWTGTGTTNSITLPDNVKATTPTMQLRLHKYGQPSDTPTNVERGGLVQVVATVTADNDPTFTPQGIRYVLTSTPTSQFTRVTNTGVLVVGPDERLSELTVAAKATYIDPSTPEVDNELSGELTVPVVGDGLLGLNAGFVTKLNFSPAGDQSLVVGKALDASVVATFTDGRTPTVTNLVALSSDKPSVATVDMSGNITAVAVGTATITATLFGVTTTMKVTVTAA